MLSARSREAALDAVNSAPMVPPLQEWRWQGERGAGLLKAANGSGGGGVMALLGELQARMVILERRGESLESARVEQVGRLQAEGLGLFAPLSALRSRVRLGPN